MLRELRVLDGDLHGKRDGIPGRLGDHQDGLRRRVVVRRLRLPGVRVHGQRRPGLVVQAERLEHGLVQGESMQVGDIVNLKSAPEPKMTVTRIGMSEEHVEVAWFHEGKLVFTNLRPDALVVAAVSEDPRLAEVTNQMLKMASDFQQLQSELSLSTVAMREARGEIASTKYVLRTLAPIEEAETLTDLAEVVKRKFDTLTAEGNAQLAALRLRLSKYE